MNAKVKLTLPTIDQEDIDLLLSQSVYVQDFTLHLLLISMTMRNMHNMFIFQTQYEHLLCALSQKIPSSTYLVFECLCIDLDFPVMTKCTGGVLRNVWWLQLVVISHCSPCLSKSDTFIPCVKC